MRPDFRRIHLQELLRHPGFAGDEIWAQRTHHIEHTGDVVAQGDVHCFNRGPERKTAIRNHDGVGMTHAGEQRENMRVQNSSFNHNVNRLIVSRLIANCTEAENEITDSFRTSTFLKPGVKSSYE